MENLAQLISINISKGGIPKLPMESVYVSVNGLEGDGHNHDKHAHPLQAVCLQDIEKLEELRQEGYPLYAGAIGENLLVCDLNVNHLPLETILEFAGGIVLEISKIRNPCYVLDSIHPKLKQDIKGRCGCYAKVIREGMLKKGETIYVSQKKLLTR